MIEDALGGIGLTPTESRRILMVAALTPEEYAAAGVPIRVDQVRELEGGGVEIRMQGALSDAEYVRKKLTDRAGAVTTEPRPVAEAAGVKVSFQARRPGADPLTRTKAEQVLQGDPYIVLTPRSGRGGGARRPSRG